MAKTLVSASGSDILLIQDIEPSNSRARLSHAALRFLAWLSNATLKISISGVSTRILMLWKANLVYSISRLRRQPQNEDVLKKEDDLKDEDKLKNEDNLKNKVNLKNEDGLKKEDYLKNEDDIKNEKTWSLVSNSSYSLPLQV